MCGIVAYVGQQEAYPILIEGLKRLEYRGYDSAGVALLNEADELNVYKTIGKPSKRPPPSLAVGQHRLDTQRYHRKLSQLAQGVGKAWFQIPILDRH